MKSLAPILLVAVLLCVILYLWRRSARTTFLHLDEPQERPSGPSLYERIREQAFKAPDKPIDDDVFPRIPEGSTGIHFAPGSIDAILGGPIGNPKDFKRVRNVIRAINRGKITSWHVVERNIRGIGAASHLDNVLRGLKRNDITPTVKRLFWEAARNSHDYEAVKWGLAIGGLFLTEQELPDLLTLARHSEFTLYASHVLVQESRRQPEYKEALFDLLPVSRQWGVIFVIDHIVEEPELISDHANQEQVLKYGMGNCEGIPMEVAFTIAKAIDIPHFLDKAGRDEDVFPAITALFHTLLLERRPLGGICDLEDGPSLFEQYSALIEARPTDMEVLGALRSMTMFLKHEDVAWDGREHLLDRTRQLYEDRMSLEIVKAGLGEERDRWLALQIIQEKKLVELLPDVLESFDAKPDTTAIDVLGHLGDASHLEAMMQKIPEIVDLPGRQERPLSPVNVLGPEHLGNMEYAWIVKYLGKLGTHEAVSQIKRAAKDYDPQVRLYAMKAVLSLPEDRIDDELRALVEERLADSPDYVAESAKHAVEKLGIRLPDKGPEEEPDS